MGSQQRCLVWLAVIAWAGLAVAPSAEPLQRKVSAIHHNLPSAPVKITESSITLTELFGSVTQPLLPGQPLKGTRIRYLNRKGQQPSTLILNIEATIVNQSAQQVEALSLAVIPMDAFGRPLLETEPGRYSLHQIKEFLPRGARADIAWEESADSPDVSEVGLAVAAALFADGSIWLAPRAQLLERFSREAR